MKIVMVSNYMNHHQLPLCEAFLQRGADFTFVALEPTADYRLSMGYKDLNHSCSFVVNAYESNALMERATSLCSDCDILILGGWHEIFSRSVKRGCTVFVYSERLFKGPFSRDIIRCLKYLPQGFFTRDAYLLSAGAYSARDRHLLGQYRGRKFKWGYFPEIKPQDSQTLLDSKEPASILWVGRFLSWKHPELAIEMAERLQQDGISFSLSMIGDGTMRAELEALIAQKKLNDCVSLLGAMSPEEVRAHMERSVVHLFTSDRGEGWGAVLNESMNSCCVAIANEAIGSVPYLIQDGVNGYSYPAGDTDTLYKRLLAVLTNPNAHLKMAAAANETMQQMWNADVAAERLMALAAALSEGKDTPFESGVCSRAE